MQRSPFMCVFILNDHCPNLDVSLQQQQLVNWDPRVIESLDDPAVSSINNFQLVPWNPKSG